MRAKLGAGKAVAAATAAVVAVAAGTTAIVLSTTQKPKHPTPVLAVPTASLSTATTPSAPQTSSAPTLTLGALTGDWAAHSAGLSIKPDGTFTVFQRVYGNAINDTAHGTGRLTTAADGVAEGEITQSDVTTGDGAIPLGTVRLTFSPDNDTVRLKLSDNQSWTFCGLNAPAGFCGA